MEMEEASVLKKVSVFDIDKKAAYKLWQEYRLANKNNPKDEFLGDMKKVYNQLKSGRKIIDISKVMAEGGINTRNEPKLAIALSSQKEVRCEYFYTGRVQFLNNKPSRYRNNFEFKRKIDIEISNVFPEILPLPGTKRQPWDNSKSMTAPVPQIPASLRPKGNLDNYYTLWEVEEWKQVPPKDPYLLRRINPLIFVVIAAWDLTELERAVMKGRMG